MEKEDISFLCIKVGNPSGPLSRKKESKNLLLVKNPVGSLFVHIEGFVQLQNFKRLLFCVFCWSGLRVQLKVELARIRLIDPYLSLN